MGRLVGRARSAPSVLFPESRTSVLDSCCTAGPPRWSPGASQGAQSAFLANWGLLAILCRLWSMPLVRFSFNFGPRLGHSTSPCVFLCVSELCPNFFGLFIRMYPTSDGPSDHADSLLLFPARFACSPLSLPRSLCSLAVFARPARLLAAAAVAAFSLSPSCSLAAPRSPSLSLPLCPSHAPAGSRAKGRLTTAAPASAMAQGKRREGTEIKQT